MPRNGSDKILNNRVENIGEVWTDFGTLISKFTKISRINSKKAGLTLQQAWALQVISVRKGISPKEISSYSGTSLPSITDLLDGLSKLNYIYRLRSSEDRRRVEISILEKGTERLLKFQKLQQSTTEKLEKALNKEDISAFSRIMGTMVKVLGSMEKTDGE
ncbi:MAG: MarR family transcriptional regulator [Candidatus Thermoplasmatota archaeon]|nr:MarR family transcriptional regulator [Candidatus Thermoplasmatota archaeon]